MGMTSINWSNQLGDFKILNCLSEEQRSSFLDMSQEVAFDKDDVILEEGDIGQQGSLYFIGAGLVSIALSGVGNNKIPIDTLGPGEFFGEMAGLEKKPRTATVIAAEDCLLRKVSGEKFQDLMSQNAVFASKVATVLSERVRRLIENVLAVKLKDFDEKLALTNTKLDASLKSVESQQKAAHDVFEGINTRANEVINSAERSRSRSTYVFTTLGVIASLLSIFVGTLISNVFENAKVTTETVKSQSADALLQIKSLEISATEISESIKSTTKEAEDRLKKSLENLDREKTLELAKLLFPFLSDGFDRLIKRNSLADLNTDRGGFLDFYSSLLKLENSDITEILFKKIEATVVRPKEIDKIIKILSIGLEEDWTRTDKQKLFSYYYLLAAYLLKGDNLQYESAFKEYKGFVKSISKPISLNKEFNPDWFETVVQYREDKDAQVKIEKIYNVWRKIPRLREG